MRFACMYIYASYMCLLPTEARRHRNPMELELQMAVGQ